MVIKDDASNQNTIVADYNALISRDKVDLLLGTFSSLLNLPASAVAERNRMLFVEPAGGAPELFDRGFKYLFFAQQATADKQGDVWAKWVTTELPEGAAAEDGRLPDARRPVRPADLGGHREDPLGGRDQDRVPQDVHDRQPEPRRDRQRGQGEQGRPGRPRRDLRGRRGHGSRAAEGELHPGHALPDDRAVARRPVLQGDRQGHDRGHLLRGQPQQGGDHARQRGVRRQVPGDVRRRRGARGRRGRLRHGARCCRRR